MVAIASGYIGMSIANVYEINGKSGAQVTAINVKFHDHNIKKHILLFIFIMQLCLTTCSLSKVTISPNFMSLFTITRSLDILYSQPPEA